MEQKKIWIIGGDQRQAVLAGLLAGDGHRVCVYGLEQSVCCEPTLDGVEQAHWVILPLPVLDSRGRLNLPLSRGVLWPEEVLDRLNAGQKIVAGKVPAGLSRQAEKRGLNLQDYYAREDLALHNAIPTAEGAIRIAMEALPITIHGAGVLVLGFGRIGQAVAPRLRALGAKVCVAARRRDQRVLAESMGLDSSALTEMGERLHTFDLVFNTIPAQVLGMEELAALKQNAVVIDLASLPGGVDDESAGTLGVKLIRALALPGKEAPLTAAAYLRDTVYHMLEG